MTKIFRYTRGPLITKDRYRRNPLAPGDERRRGRYHGCRVLCRRIQTVAHARGSH